MKNFKHLEIWKRSMSLVKRIYGLTDNFPKTEIYGITSQIRRSAVSIPSNIAEGCGKNSMADLARFVDIAFGSSFELETQLLLSKDLEYGNASELKACLDELNQIQKMINKYLQSLRASK